MTLYRVAARSYLACLPLIVVVVILLAVVGGIFRTSNAEPVYVLLGYTFVAIMGHRAILLGETMWSGDGWTRPPETHPEMHAGRFLWLVVLFGLAPCAIVYVASFLAPTGPNAAGWIVLSAVAGATLHAIILSIWGTALPAAAKGEAMTLHQARTRGAPLFWRTFWRLIMGPGLFALIFGAVLITGLALPPLPAFLTIIISAAFEIGASLGIFLAVSALSLAYRETQPN